MSFNQWLCLLLIYLQITNQIDWHWGVIFFPLAIDIVIMLLNDLLGDGD